MDCKPIIWILQDECGATAIEYGLIAALVSIAAILAISAMGESSTSLIDGVVTRFNDAWN